MTNAVKELGIDKNLMKMWNDENPIYTEEEIDAIYSDNPYEINTIFANENTILKDGNILTRSFIHNCPDEVKIFNLSQEEIEMLRNEQLPGQLELIERISHPTVPCYVSLVTATEQSLLISWIPSQDEIGIDHYNIYVDGINRGCSTDNLYTITNLLPDHSNLIEVEAVNSIGLYSEKSQGVPLTTNKE